MARIALSDDSNHHPRRCEADGIEQAFEAAPGEQSEETRRERAIQRIAALGEMTGGIAHDFRNILTIIQSGLRLAERNLRDPDKLRACIAGAREGVDRGLQLTSQLLAFAKQQELEPRPGNANELLRNLELLLRYSAGLDIRVVLELASDIPECLIDPPQFNAAVLNLVVNARDAMLDGGEVRISTARCESKNSTIGSPPPGAYVRVRVKDSGQGMPAEVLQHIFDPLFTTKGEKGTGLGLPQVCAFMRLIGGHIGVASEPGIGTTVDLLFPSAQAQADVPSPESETFAMSIEQETRTVPEAVGIFHSPEDLQGAIDDLLSSGFDRAELSLLASEFAVEEKLGHRYEKVSTLADHLSVARTAYVSTEAIGGAEGALIGGLMYVGAAVGAGAIVASGGSLAAAIAGVALTGGAGGLIGSILAKWVRDHHAHHLQEQLDRGGLLLWVRTWTVKTRSAPWQFSRSIRAATSTSIHCP
jgi:nitrogen-specific signal transduction histidine kinase